MSRVLKAWINSLLDNLSFIISLFFSYNLIKRIKKFANSIQQHSLERCFASIGKGCYIEFPCMVTNPQNIFIGDNFSAQSMLRLETFEEYAGNKFSPKLTIGNNVTFNNDCHIGCINQIEIGNNVLFSSRIIIIDHFHGDLSIGDLHTPPAERALSTKGPVIIRDNVWIGDGVAIFSGVTIGMNAIVGANSVVTKNIPNNAVVAGVPAKVIKFLGE